MSKEEEFEDDVSLSPSPPPEGEASTSANPETQSATTITNNDDDANNDAAEEFEDALDLDMSRTGQKMWLVKLPEFLMDRWKTKQHNGELLGKVRIPEGQDFNDDWKASLELDPSTELNQDVPQRYDLHLTKRTVDNTFVFTEKDLPKYKKAKKDKLTAEGAQNERDAREATREDARAKGKSKYKYSKDRDTNYVPFVKTIPKNTALVGTVFHEYNLQPDINDPNYSNIIGQRRLALQSNAPSRQRVTMLDSIPGYNAPVIGESLSSKNESTFIKAQKKDKKSTEGKATRMPRNELLDILFKLFEEYEYWSLRGLRERTNQPETYLKEVLTTMATLIRKGPYALKYSLKPEFKQIKGTDQSLANYMTEQGIDIGADDAEGGAAEDEEDEDEEMENVDLTES